MSLLRDVIWTPAAGSVCCRIGSAAGRHGSGNSGRQSALDPGFHAFPLARRTRTVMLVVSAW